MNKPSPKSRKRRNKPIPRDAEASRARILDAARVRFSNYSYEGVGVREITSDAGCDAALVSRYFGSKEGLFRVIASQAFGTAELLSNGVDGLARNAADWLFGPLDAKDWRTGYDPLRLLLASIGSPIAGPILSEYLLKDFVRPLQQAIGETRSGQRGAFLAAQIVGTALVRIVLSSNSSSRHTELQALFLESLETLLQRSRA